MKNALIYDRVSSKEQLDGSSLETQEKINRDWAKKNDYEVVKVFTEKGESAKTADRTELKAMLNYVAKNYKQLDAVIVYKIDRLARNTLDHATLKLFFNRYGIKLISATENLEDTPVGRLMENQLAGFAQFDNEIRTERSTNGMIAAVQAGRYVWGAPIGYINTGGRGTSNLAYHPDPEKVRLTKKLWEYVDTGYEVEEARKKLWKEGLKISKTHVYRMLRNKAYMGVIEKFGICIVGTFTPLIEPSLFIRVQNKIDRTSHKIPIYRVNNPDFPIRGLVKCDKCEKELTGSWSRGNGGKYPYYRCNKCRKVNYKRDKVESGFIEYLNGYKSKRGSPSGYRSKSRA